MARKSSGTDGPNDRRAHAGDLHAPPRRVEPRAAPRRGRRRRRRRGPRLEAGGQEDGRPRQARLRGPALRDLVLPRAPQERQVRDAARALLPPQGRRGLAVAHAGRMQRARGRVPTVGTATSRRPLARRSVADAATIFDCPRFALGITTSARGCCAGRLRWRTAGRAAASARGGRRFRRAVDSKFFAPLAGARGRAPSRRRR